VAVNLPKRLIYNKASTTENQWWHAGNTAMERAAEQENAHHPRPKTPRCKRIPDIRLSDSSVTYTRAVRPWPSPAVLQYFRAAGISEVSRFSCMKFLGVSGVYDYAGLIVGSRYRSRSAHQEKGRLVAPPFSQPRKCND